jgi:hypothetical protein
VVSWILKRRLYPVVKHGARITITLVALPFACMVIPGAIAALARGRLDGALHWSIGACHLLFLALSFNTLPIIAVAISLALGARLVLRRSVQKPPRLQVDATAPLLAAGDHCDGTGAS